MLESNRSILSGMTILVDGKWLTDSAVVIDGTEIKAIIPTEMIPHHLPAKQYHFPATYQLVPGFIDLHIHGTNGHDVMDEDEASLSRISKALAEEGVTGFLATTMTSKNERIEKVLAHAGKARTQLTGAALLGLHLEGPFIAKEKMGAQLAAEIKAPDLILVEEWLKKAHHLIKIMTLAPELPQALSLISFLVDHHIIAAIGHTNANYEQTQAAIDAGCSYATHLFNAMSGLHQREPGAVTALLLSKHVSAELIIDGLHLHPAIIELVYQVKGKEHLLLVTDAMRAKSLGDGEYELGTQAVKVQQGAARLADGTIAGSTLQMPTAIKNMQLFTRCDLADAIAMASAVPARIIGMEHQKGCIKVGFDADLVVMNQAFQVMLTLREGREVFKK
jgi:N-acetylglucosamine-6-phosphate deacetylase